MVGKVNSGSQRRNNMKIIKFILLGVGELCGAFLVWFFLGLFGNFVITSILHTTSLGMWFMAPVFGFFVILLVCSVSYVIYLWITWNWRIVSKDNYRGF